MVWRRGPLRASRPLSLHASPSATSRASKPPHDADPGDGARGVMRLHAVRVAPGHLQRPVPGGALRVGCRG